MDTKQKDTNMGQMCYLPQDKMCPNCNGHYLKSFQAIAHDAAQPAFVNIIECTSCEFAWQYPLARTSDQSVRFFEEAYENYEATKNEYFDRDKKRQIATMQFQFVNKLPTSGRRLLDIGAGSGIFAEISSNNGWEVTAVDPALEIENIKSKKSLRLIKGAVSEIPNGTSFDIITMWDIIEHVEDPLAMIITAKEYLADGGWLVLETGNYKSVDRVANGYNSWIYQLDHRWYFSPDSLEKLLKYVGYSEIIFSNIVFRPQWNGKSEYGGPSLVKLLKKIIRHPINTRSHIEKHIKLSAARKWAMPSMPIFTIAAR